MTLAAKPNPSPIPGGRFFLCVDGVYKKDHTQKPLQIAKWTFKISNKAKENIDAIIELFRLRKENEILKNTYGMKLDRDNPTIAQNLKTLEWVVIIDESRGDSLEVIKNDGRKVRIQANYLIKESFAKVKATDNKISESQREALKKLP